MLLAAILAFAFALVVGIGLGSAGLPSFGGLFDGAEAEDADAPCGDRVADPDARLCYSAPSGWEHSTWPLDVGPTSGLSSDAGEVIVGPLRVLPIDTPTDPESIARVLIEYGVTYFDAGKIGTVEVESREIDERDAVYATAPLTVDGESGVIAVTIVVVDDEVVSYVMGFAAEGERAEQLATVHDGLGILPK
ncbi:hypothetical protein STSO111631_07660 [Stackebrandtia soli]